MTHSKPLRWQVSDQALANSVVVCNLTVHVAPKHGALIPRNSLSLFICPRNLWNWKHAADAQ